MERWLNGQAYEWADKSKTDECTEKLIDRWMNDSVIMRCLSSKKDNKLICLSTLNLGQKQKM